MQARTLKNSKLPKLIFWLTLACLVVMPLFTPGHAHAYDFYAPDLGLDSDEVCPGPGLTRRIMPCVKETMLYVTNMMLVPFSDYLASTVTACCVLAIALLGILMIGGKTTAPFKDTLVLLAKLGGVSMFSYNFGGALGLLLDSMDSLLGIVSGFIFFSGSFGQSAILYECPDLQRILGDPPVLQVWDAVDCSINSLIGGIFSPLSLTMGITGFIVSCLTSNTLGMAIGLLGLRLMLQLIWAVVRSLYMFVTAYMGICLLVLVSPIFIPTILFQATRGYFDRWLKVLMSFMLQPVILFIYLAMLLTAFDMVVFSGPNSLYAVITGDAAEEDGFRLPMSEGGQGGIGGWLWTNGGYAKDYKSAFGVNINPKESKKKDKKMAGMRPSRSVDTGVGGIMDARLAAPTEESGGMSITQNRQRDILDNMGLGFSGKDPNPDNPSGPTQLNYFEFNLPVETVDWGFLAVKNNVDPDDKDALLAFLFKIYISFLMAMITGYVFIELLDTLPFIGSGLAMSKGLTDEKSLGIGGMPKMAPPGSDFMKNVKDKMLSSGT